MISQLFWHVFDYRNTWFYNHQSQAWTSGPDMKNPRVFHSCGSKMIDGELVLVVAGEDYVDGNYVEFLPVNGRRWVSGPSVPDYLDATIVFNEDDLYFVDTSSLNRMFRLDCPTSMSSCQWQKMEQKLEKSRNGAVVSLIPDYMTSCA